MKVSHESIAGTRLNASFPMPIQDITQLSLGKVAFQKKNLSLTQLHSRVYVYHLQLSLCDAWHRVVQGLACAPRKPKLCSKQVF